MIICLDIYAALKPVAHPLNDPPEINPVVFNMLKGAQHQLRLFAGLNTTAMRSVTNESYNDENEIRQRYAKYKYPHAANYEQWLAAARRRATTFVHTPARVTAELTFLLDQLANHHVLSIHLALGYPETNMRERIQAQNALKAALKHIQPTPQVRTEHPSVMLGDMYNTPGHEYKWLWINEQKIHYTLEDLQYDFLDKDVPINMIPNPHKGAIRT